MKLIQLLFLSAAVASGGVFAASHATGNDGKGQHHQHQHQHQHGGKHGQHRGMRHASPMPHLMRVVMHHGDQLDLAAEQSAALNEWHDRLREAMHSRKDQIRQMEQALYEAALAGQPKAELMNRASRIMAVRMQIVAIETDTRDYLRRVLSDEQYAKVLSIHTDMQANKGQHKRKHKQKHKHKDKQGQKGCARAQHNN